VQRMIKSVRH